MEGEEDDDDDKEGTSDNLAKVRDLSCDATMRHLENVPLTSIPPTVSRAGDCPPLGENNDLPAAEFRNNNA